MGSQPHRKQAQKLVRKPGELHKLLQVHVHMGNPNDLNDLYSVNGLWC